MPWYLPDRYPLFWEGVRRRVLGRHLRRVMHMGIVLTAISLVIGLGPFLLGDSSSYDRDYWRMIMAIEAFLAMLLAPALAVGSFTAERERGSLDFLFLTPQTTRSLVLQRFAGCVILPAGVILCFLLANAQTALAGHVPLRDVLAEYLFQFIQASAFVAFALMASCLASNTRVAVVFTYSCLFLLEYGGHWLLGEQLIHNYAISQSTPLWQLLTGPWQALFAPLPYLALAVLSLWECTRALERQRRPVTHGGQQQRVHSRGVTDHPTPRWYLPDNYPIFWDDLRRRLRGGRTYTVLLGFGLAICAILVIAAFCADLHSDPQEWPQFGHTLFMSLMGGQFVLMWIISPGLTATIFSSEREAQRADFLLLSKLTSRQLVYEKFFSALAVQLLILVCGAPAIAIIAATFGGIAPWELALGYLCVLLVSLFSASTALLYSCNAKTSSAALLQGYLYAIFATAGLLTVWYIGWLLAIIWTFINLNRAAKRLDEWRHNLEQEDSYALLRMKGVKGRQ